MRNYEQGSMVNKVHKNVKYMLSEAREIINIKNRIPLTFKRNNISNERISFKNLNNVSCQLNQSQRYPNRQQQPKIKGRMLKLRTSLQHEEDSNGENHLQTLSKEEIEQLKLLSHLNKQEIELVQTSRRSIKIGTLLRQNDYILPPISTKRIYKSINKSSKDCFQFSIEPLQEAKMQKMKKFKTIQSISSSNIISYLQKHKKKSNPFSSKSKQKQKRAQIKLDLQYQPWNNAADPTDIFFQL